MPERLDALTPRVGRDGKTYWTKIGRAWPLKDGGWRVVFEALPLPSRNREGDLETMVILRPPFEREANVHPLPQRWDRSPPPQGPSGREKSALDDNIEF